MTWTDESLQAATWTIAQSGSQAATTQGLPFGLLLALTQPGVVAGSGDWENTGSAVTSWQ